ncbi:SIMPL domain-containing protein [candidate division WOR-3 bacterium]|uniref:SIMPL domain-containing protein n=1 Tax=candidate division WOR-3 bacterium TaxID=2052148 RepID=A0A937XFE1_UNCW3|nr:SIMPL domain-containing protein [candidate division WOR-3 bacterium]
MRTMIAIILGISFVVGAAVFGNYFYRSRSQDNTIRVVGAATKRYESDIVKWRISVGRNTGLGDVSAGYADTRRTFDGLMAELKAAGINEKEISVQPINRNPTFDNNGNNTGYSFNQSVYVISSDVGAVEKLALNPNEMFQKGVALQSSTLEYYFSKLPDIKKELLAEATRDARERAVEIAKNSGSGIGAMRSARAGIFQITEPYSTEVSDYGIYNTSTRQKDVTVTVTAEFGVR